ncbi:hypothetical protein COU38_03440 [Candidatus Micrarchaeota archaeon CG10_big_fil_rev_8_21_14_0_10_54_18]|nr:MAG: hypothetical protein AUJ15_01135 [Candidatus Micrarchaeota archaeon CG1_02_55_41]PIO03847.1 MAG: hypothetical protein COT57_00210 [Candidatus Micrarchaeota archaeon CG09_land_8_20_14_0_10_55_25]PJD01001.1 MAG: hypothetical protein COU38_03440 [Candidatus Micrarchaeota archaeon CG10_big_fil_rev_8_21_14_0_10_54_18]
MPESSELPTTRELQKRLRLLSDHKDPDVRYRAQTLRVYVNLCNEQEHFGARHRSALDNAITSLTEKGPWRSSFDLMARLEPNDAQAFGELNSALGRRFNRGRS